MYGCSTQQGPLSGPPGGRRYRRETARQDCGGVPEEAWFATKLALARQMIAAALNAGVPAGRVTSDEVYGADPGLRADLEQRAIRTT
ncbi:transposase [Micromonospora halotolerans]|uniref:Transposase n=2 Tax=Micromonospora halotolerans TaxID=709879 RepID=A0ABY9ZSL8_9ACTN|nr:transposase [Micromonospora halotolerans]WNM37575.1 transposase [Micromonospora halotolerans]